MKLLFDQNLSFRLVDLLAGDFPNSAHVRDVGLAAGSDQQVWDFAKSNEYVLVSKDTDFQQRALLYGAPPKVIWIRLGNCSTDAVGQLLKLRKTDVAEFAADAPSAFLALS